MPESTSELVRFADLMVACGQWNPEIADYAREAAKAPEEKAPEEKAPEKAPPPMKPKATHAHTHARRTTRSR